MQRSPKCYTQPYDTSCPSFPAPSFYRKEMKDGSMKELPSYVRRAPMGEPTKLIPVSVYGKAIRVVTWNVLSSTLTKNTDGKMRLPSGEPNPAVSPEHEPTRIVQIFDRLRELLEKGEVVLLQETNWEFRMLSELHKLLDEFGYTMVATNFGFLRLKGQKTGVHGFLGVGILIPPSLKLLDCKTPNFTEHAQFKDRKIIVALVQDVFGRKFVLSSVHAPCYYSNIPALQEIVVNIGEVVVLAAKEWSGSDDLIPIIMGGDFNLNYYDGEGLKKLGFDMAHTFDRSHGTNYSCRIKEQGIVEETVYLLDYIFTKGAKRVEAKELPKLEIGKDVLPNMRFPSDHVYIEADVFLPAPNQQNGLEALTDALFSTKSK